MPSFCSIVFPRCSAQNEQKTIRPEGNTVSSETSSLMFALIGWTKDEKRMYPRPWCRACHWISKWPSLVFGVWRRTLCANFSTKISTRKFPTSFHRPLPVPYSQYAHHTIHWQSPNKKRRSRQQHLCKQYSPRFRSSIVCCYHWITTVRCLRICLLRFVRICLKICYYRKPLNGGEVAKCLVEPVQFYVPINLSDPPAKITTVWSFAEIVLAHHSSNVSAVSPSSETENVEITMGTTNMCWGWVTAVENKMCIDLLEDYASALSSSSVWKSRKSVSNVLAQTPWRSSMWLL